MKPWFIIIYVFAVIILAGGDFRIRGKVRKRHTTYRRNRAVLTPCPFNDTLIEDEALLMDLIGRSKFIFTAKVLNARKVKPGDRVGGKRSNLYKVYMRRVLKGDISELAGIAKSEGNPETLSGATILAERERARESCAPARAAPRARLSAIFLSDGVYNAVSRSSRTLHLLSDPVPLTLYYLDKVNAAVKGKIACDK